MLRRNRRRALVPKLAVGEMAVGPAGERGRHDPMSTTEDGHNVSADEHDGYEVAAQAAAKVADPVAMLEALGRGRFLDGLKRQLRRKWLRLDDNDVDWVIGMTVDALYDRVKGGAAITDIFPFMVKAARNKASDLNGQLALEDPYEADDDTRKAPDEITDEDREAIDTVAEEKRGQMYVVLKAMVARIGQDRPRQVIGFIVDAFSKGAYDVTNQEIADALNLSLGTVKVAKHRGFERLEDIAKETGAVTVDFTLKDLELQDETIAAMAAENEGEI